MGWLELDSGDIARARGVLRSMQQEGVLDELGFGPLQTAFADWFYPSTNTIMTRARYLYFVAAIYRFVESLRDRHDAAMLVRKKQDALRRGLSTSEDAGVIGARKGEDIQRLPSNIYWGAFRDLGMFQRRMFEPAYIAELTGTTRRRGLDDEGQPLTRDAVRNWDPELPLVDLSGTAGEFPADAASFALTKAEGVDLLQRFRALETRRGRPSLITWLVDSDVLRRDPLLRYPWSGTGHPDALARGLDHARRLSAAARGATIAYHHALQRLRREKGHPPAKIDLEAPAERWWSEQRDAVRDWNLDDITEQLRQIDHAARRIALDVRFLRELQATLRYAVCSADWLRATDTLRVIADRERRTRPRKARLQRDAWLFSWVPRSQHAYEGSYELSYRHGIGSSFGRDIVAALGRAA